MENQNKNYHKNLVMRILIVNEIMNGINEKSGKEYTLVKAYTKTGEKGTPENPRPENQGVMHFSLFASPSVAETLKNNRVGKNDSIHMYIDEKGISSKNSKDNKEIYSSLNGDIRKIISIYSKGKLVYSAPEKENSNTEHEKNHHVQENSSQKNQPQASSGNQGDEKEWFNEENLDETHTAQIKEWVKKGLNPVAKIREVYKLSKKMAQRVESVAQSS